MFEIDTWTWYLVFRHRFIPWRMVRLLKIISVRMSLVCLRIHSIIEKYMKIVGKHTYVNIRTCIGWSGRTKEWWPENRQSKLLLSPSGNKSKRSFCHFCENSKINTEKYMDALHTYIHKIQPTKHTKTYNRTKHLVFLFATHTHTHTKAFLLHSYRLVRFWLGFSCENIDTHIR